MLVEQWQMVIGTTDVYPSVLRDNGDRVFVAGRFSGTLEVPGHKPAKAEADGDGFGILFGQPGKVIYSRIWDGPQNLGSDPDN